MIWPPFWETFWGSDYVNELTRLVYCARSWMKTDRKIWILFPVNWTVVHSKSLLEHFWSKCTLQKITTEVKGEDLKSRNTSISQSMDFSCDIWQIWYFGFEQPLTSCSLCLWQLTTERVRVHPEWLFQSPHLDAEAELEWKWIDSLSHLPFINSRGLGEQWFSSLGYISLNGSRSFRGFR